MNVIGVLFICAACITVSVCVLDQCMERYKVCSVKDRFTLQRICRRSGGVLKHALKYAGKGELFEFNITMRREMNALTGVFTSRRCLTIFWRKVIFEKFTKITTVGNSRNELFSINIGFSEIISDCCRPGGCTRQYLCDFCENSCCQIAIDTITTD
ncbi:unnamed protein product [Gongylonema pulchrum]|uniref:IlGF domain-containing protein n=1 Tax=Gongylonema pulchrum TaxID=637853 RepID=A0A183DEM1_9BILA|nr:unnamed protein product [Gongylonema pulchrum]